MRFEGVLSAWDPEAGRGAIRPKGGGQEVPVRLAAFPMDGDEPHMDEVLSFEIVSSRDGTKQAARVQRLVQTDRETMAGALRDVAPVARRSRTLQRKQRRTQWMVAGACVMLVAVGVVFWAVKPVHGQTLAEVQASVRR
jgi:cold shock CspA family protein